MPSSYTGNPTATQAPAAAPTPENAPIASLPSDGDALNAASVAQAFKVVADYIAHLKLPRAASGSWAEAVRRFLNARLQTRFLVDHMGFPAGKIQGWREDWSGRFPVTGLSVAEPFGERWEMRCTGDALATALITPPNTSTWPWSFRCAQTVSLSAPKLVHVEAHGQVMQGNDIATAMQWDHGWAGPTGDVELAHGLATSLSGLDGGFLANDPVGAAFVKRTPDSNWFCYYHPVGGSATLTNSGVAVLGTAGTDNRRRFRIEVVGSGVADDSAAHTHYYIDGVKVLTVNATMGQALLRPFGRTVRINDTSSFTQYLGVVDFAANTWPGDVQI